MESNKGFIFKKLNKHILPLCFMLIILQPILDSISFWANTFNLNAVTTLLRMLIFVIISIFSILVAANKKNCLIFYGIIFIFGVLHFLNCFRVGYISFGADLGMFFRMIQMPIIAFSFIIFFKNQSKLEKAVSKGFFYVFWITIIILAISLITKTSVYTYPDSKNGFSGWVVMQNTQSIIISAIFPLVLYFAYKKGILWFTACSFLGVANLYFNATRFAFISIFVVTLGFGFLLILTKCQKISFYAVLIIPAVICICTYTYSPMYQERYGRTQEINKEQMKIEEQKKIKFENEKTNKYSLENFKTLYTPYLKDMIDRFGIEKVAKIYKYTFDVNKLMNFRIMKRNFAKLIWRECDFTTKIFGFEYAKMIYNDRIFALENDLPLILYQYGYLGFSLYFGFIGYFVLLILISLVRKFKDIFTIECGSVGLCFVLLIFSAWQIGHTLMRPNVSIYLSIILGYIYYLVTIKNGIEFKIRGEK